MSRFVFVMVSKDEQFAHSSECNNVETPHNMKVLKIINNTKPLANVYNICLKEHRARVGAGLDPEQDFIVFMHADVKLDLNALANHVFECRDKYDVMGLCGCQQFDVSECPLNWYCGSKKFPESRWGCVTHGELGNQTAYFSSHHAAMLDHEVACIDGLCIVFGPKALAAKGLLFDERFDFNQYDTDISMQTVLQEKLKLGVVVQMDLLHQSVGKSILDPKFLVGEKVLREKWGWKLPDAMVSSTAAQ